MQEEVDILYEPNEVWSLFLAAKKAVDKDYLLAYDYHGYEVVMTPRMNDDFIEPIILPYISARYFDEEIEADVCINESDCFNTVKEFYSMLEDKPWSSEIIDKENKGAEEAEAIEAEIKEREDELFWLTSDYLENVVCDPKDFEKYVDEDIIKNLTDKFLAFIDKEGIPVYRPTMLEERDGTMVYTEYPYRMLRGDED